MADKKDWKEKLSPKEYRVLREGATEPPFTGKLLFNKRDGVYKCTACGEELFSSETKYESGTGWPSFFDALDKEKLKIEDDTSFGMVRKEVVCANCDSHLGHLFGDGPEPTGKRYCINSTALSFEGKD